MTTRANVTIRRWITCGLCGARPALGDGVCESCTPTTAAAQIAGLEVGEHESRLAYASFVSKRPRCARCETDARVLVNGEPLCYACGNEGVCAHCDGNGNACGVCGGIGRSIKWSSRVAIVVVPTDHLLRLIREARS